MMQLLREAGFADLEQDQLPWFIEALILADRLDEAEAEICHVVTGPDPELFQSHLQRQRSSPSQTCTDDFQRHYLNSFLMK